MRYLHYITTGWLLWRLLIPVSEEAKIYKELTQGQQIYKTRSECEAQGQALTKEFREIRANGTYEASPGIVFKPYFACKLDILTPKHAENALRVDTHVPLVEEKPGEPQQ